MNPEQRMALRIVGVVIFACALAFNIIVPNMGDPNEIRLMDNLCNAQLDVLGNQINIGEIGQLVLDKGLDCNKIHIVRMGLDYSWVAMALGVAMFFIGVWAGLGKKGRKEMSV